MDHQGIHGLLYLLRPRRRLSIPESVLPSKTRRGWRCVSFRVENYRHGETMR
jgi:hypothetical protein